MPSDEDSDQDLTSAGRVPPEMARLIVSRRLLLGACALGSLAMVAGDAFGAFGELPPAEASIPYVYPTDPFRPGTQWFTQYGASRAHGLHQGLDTYASHWHPINSIAAGVVIGGNWTPSGGYGYHVKIRNDDGVEALYAHFAAAPLVSVGSRVSVGQRIGSMGGSAAGILNKHAFHLHIEIRPGGGSTIDPLPFLHDKVSGTPLPPPPEHEENEMRPINIWNANTATVNFRGATIGYTTVEVQRYPTVLKAKARAERFFSYALEVSQEEFDGYIADVNERRAQMNLAPIVWPSS